MKLIIKDNILPLPEEEGYLIFSPEQAILPCTGCYQCWIRTPGRCVLEDAYASMASLLSRADDVCLVSRMVYGSVSPFVKNVFDRSLSFLLPFFEEKDGRSHHPLRYPNRYRMHYLIYGEATEAEKETLIRFAKANGKNREAEVDVQFFASWEELKEAMNENRSY